MVRTTALFVLIGLGTSVSIQGCAPAGVAAGAATGAVVAHDRRSTGAYVDDEIIEWKIFEVIRSDDGLRDQAHINATSFNGIVLLTGEVPSEELRQRAVDLAKGVNKVRQVHDEITVAAPSSMLSRSGDTWITGKVKTAIFNDNTDLASRTKVVTEKGIVYLMGIVTPDEAESATEIARRVGGVQRVVKVFEYQS